VAPRVPAFRPYAIATEARSPALPKVSAWNALFAPKDTPKDIVTKLNQTLVKALDDESARKRLLELGSVLPEGAARSPQALADLVKTELARWTPILKATGAVGGQ
jgi:tripartite-type tricarboxylate transporter receptor subunit TctC